MAAARRKFIFIYFKQLQYFGRNDVDKKRARLTKVFAEKVFANLRKHIFRRNFVKLFSAYIQTVYFCSCSECRWARESRVLTAGLGKNSLMVT